MELYISFIEVLSILLIYNLLINGELFKNIKIYLIAAVITSVFYFVMAGLYSIESVVVLIGGMFINAILISNIEKKDTIIVLIEIIACSIIILIIELIVTFIIHLLLGEYIVNPIGYLIVLMFSMCLFIVTLKIALKGKGFSLTNFFSKYRSVNIVILNLFIFFLLVKVIAVNDLMKTKIVIQITILGLLLIGINAYFYLYLYRTNKNMKKNEIKKSFNPLINELMSKVKANEHEYKKHLNAIYGITQLSKPEEIKEKIKSYIGTIVSDDEEFSRLLNIDNTIVKAVLYNKIQRAEKLGISCKYTVTSDLRDIPVDDSELTVIFSNLLNNAIEATSMIKNKEMEVVISEDLYRYKITVYNKTEDLTLEKLVDIFKIGYSTKGEGRGYGLYNVKKIVDKYKGKIKVDLDGDIVKMSIIFMK